MPPIIRLLDTFNEMTGDSSSSSSLSSMFVADSMDCVRLRMIKRMEDIDDETLNFAPEFCHQFFGENETIFGYTKLKVRILTTFCDCQSFLQISYKQKCNSDMKPDDIYAALKKLYPDSHGLTTNFDSFRQAVEKQHEYKPFGELLHVYSIEQGKEKQEFHIYKVDGCNFKTKQFVRFYERIEMFAFWFIETTSNVDTSDERWSYYITYQKYLDENQRVCYGFIGYSSVYMYYAYPEHLRPRIGHFLILPPFHKNGHGFQLLQAINNDFLPDPKVLEIVAEDPVLNFVKLRDYVDCVNCCKVLYKDDPNLSELLTVDDDQNREKFKKFAKEMQTRLKVGKAQSRRVYEILRLKAINANDEEQFRNYRLEVKRRLYTPLKKSQKDLKQINKALTPEETKAAVISSSRENVYQTLESLFEQTMEEYKPVLARLAVERQTLPEIRPAA